MGDQIKIFVTGASGYIGSRACSYLSAQGFDIYGLSRDNGGFVKGDFGDENRMIEILNDIQPDIVLHCAGVTPHRNATENDYFKVNFERSKNLLKTLSSSGLSRGSSQYQKDYPIKSGNDRVGFINCSTIGVYGVPIVDSVVYEGDICLPRSPYAQSKYDFEMELGRSDVPYVNVRIANIPGRDAFINYVVENKTVNFYGDVPYVRDYIHLDDLNALFESSIKYLMHDGANLTVNAGAGVGCSFPDIADEIERQTNQKIKRNNHPIKSDDVVKIICDIQRAKNVLGWEPQKIDLKEIVNYALHNR